MPSTKPKKTVAPMTLAEAMRALEKGGSEQTRKIYLRHGAQEPLFGVTMATLKPLVKRIGVDNDLALELWGTGNHDARTLAMKIADPQAMSPRDLDRLAAENRQGMCSLLLAALTAEGPHAMPKATRWLASADPVVRATGWMLVGQMALLDEATADAWFGERLAEVEKSIDSAPNDVRAAMNGAVIAIGCRNAGLRKAAVAAAKRVGKVEVDHGDTACKTPDAVPYIEKMWGYAAARKAASPAAQERARESMRTRC